MRTRVRRQPVVYALWANAALLFAILVVLVMRGGDSSLMPMALAQRQAPIAGGAGTFIMPAQLSSSTWGCYMLDVDAQTLSVYYYHPSDRTLRFIAARNYTWDRRVKNYNTSPDPREIEDMVERASRELRGVPADTTPQAPAPEAQD